MEVKVCGVRDAAVAVAAAKLGVDYLGFIFEPSSPRHVTVEQAAEIAASLGAEARRRVRLVGVFVHGTPGEIAAAMRRAGLDVVQLHRRATAEDVAALKSAGYEVWTLAGGAEGDGVLFDSTHGDGETAFRQVDGKSIVAGRIGLENLTGRRGRQQLARDRARGEKRRAAGRFHARLCRGKGGGQCKGKGMK